jgi:hypothetical protein
MLRSSSKNDWAVAGFLLGSLILVSLVNFSTVQVKPNVFIVVPIAAALLVESWYVFFGLLLTELLWLKFTPFLAFEYGIVFLLGACSFVIARLLIFRKIFPVRLFFVLVLQTLFWFAVQATSQIVSLVFLLELIYNVIIEELLFALGSWIKKRFS